MSYGSIICLVMIILFVKIVYDISSIKAGEVTSTLLRIMICFALLFVLLVCLLFLFLLKYIKEEVNASEAVNTVIETTEMFNFNSQEHQMEECRIIDNSNNSQVNSSKGGKKPAKIKTVKTVSRSRSRERNASYGGIINKLASTLIKYEKPQNEEKMVDKEEDGRKIK